MLHEVADLNLVIGIVVGLVDIGIGSGICWGDQASWNQEFKDTILAKRRGEESRGEQDEKQSGRKTDSQALTQEL